MGRPISRNPRALTARIDITAPSAARVPEFRNPHFVIAFALGATATVLLSVGLFALSFHSSRSGHDEQIGNEQDSDGA
jgi:hypothetical protein